MMPFAFVVTNLRLNAYNGLHLVILAAATDSPPRSVVYTDRRELVMARDVQRAGAFYETGECLPVTLAAYFHGTLPPADRRDPSEPERRANVRGGRRSWDHHVFAGSA